MRLCSQQMNGMTMENEMYVISVYSENQVGLLSSISSIFTRRNINIESLTVFPSEFPGIHHFTFRVRTTPEMSERLVKLIERKVDVIKAFYYPCDEEQAKEHDRVSEYLMSRNNINLK